MKKNRKSSSKNTTQRPLFRFLVLGGVLLALCLLCWYTAMFPPQFLYDNFQFDVKYPNAKQLAIMLTSKSQQNFGQVSLGPTQHNGEQDIVVDHKIETYATPTYTSRKPLDFK